jgi:hypothetical protein
VPNVSCVRGCSRALRGPTPTSIGVSAQRQSVLGRSREAGRAEELEIGVRRPKEEWKAGAVEGTA